MLFIYSVIYGDSETKHQKGVINAKDEKSAIGYVMKHNRGHLNPAMIEIRQIQECEGIIYTHTHVEHYGYDL